jgi:hypothetical protein
MYILRSYQHIAQISHWCDRCCRHIEAGEIYTGSVQVINRRLIVFKTHIFPACDEPPDPEDLENMEMEDDEILMLLAA